MNLHPRDDRLAGKSTRVAGEVVVGAADPHWLRVRMQDPKEVKNCTNVQCESRSFYGKKKLNSFKTVISMFVISIYHSSLLRIAHTLNQTKRNTGIH